MEFQSVERASDAFQESVTPDQISAMCHRAVGAGMEVVSAVELGGGLYNNTYRVEIGEDRPVILRVAPEPGRQSRIERALMRNEHASLPFFAPIAAMMPRTLFVDWTREILGRDYLWQTMLDGMPAPGGLRAYPRPRWAEFYRQLGTIAKRVHGVRGERFGPVAWPTFTTWSEAVICSLEDTAADLEDAGLDAGDVREVVAVAGRRRTVLDEIDEPRLLHGDLWVPNVMLALDTPEPTITGVLDHDRASWGDPAADWTTWMIAQRPATERAAFWETYGVPPDTARAVWRAQIYRARHVSAVRLERHRLRRHTKIAGSYAEMREVLDLLAVWTPWVNFRCHTTVVRELRTLPKAHLHLHLTGSARLATVRELADKYGIVLPSELMNEEVDWGDGGRDWSHFQFRYNAARQTIQSAEDIHRIIREAAADDAAEGSQWLELQVDPSSYARHLGGLDQAVEVMVGACQDAGRAAGIGIGLLLAVSWGASSKQAERVALLAARYAHRGVVGFGISNDERLGEPDVFVSASRIARDAGLLVAPHTGCYTDHSHVRRCVELLGARRIGHGITAAMSNRTLEILARSQVTMEICPTSYLPLGLFSALAQVPVAAFQRAGVSVALGADDPLIFGTRLIGQYEILRDVHGLNDQALADLASQSVRASTAPAEVTERLLADITRWIR